MKLNLGLICAITLAGAAVFDVEAGSAGRCGGTGGNRTKTLECGPGEYIVGFGARAGQFIDQVSITCQPLPAGGAPGAKRDSISAGPGGGHYSAFESCKRKKAINSIKVFSGAWIDRIDHFTCQARDEDGEWSNPADTRNVYAGGAGGIFCTIKCPDGEALYKLTVKSGGWVDSIKGDCRR